MALRRAREQQQKVDAGGGQAASQTTGRRQVEFSDRGGTSEECRRGPWRLSILKAIERFASNSNAIQPTPGRRRWTPDDDKRLMELRTKGASFNEIANALGRIEAAIEQRAKTLKRQAAAQRLWTLD